MKAARGRVVGALIALVVLAWGCKEEGPAASGSSRPDGVASTTRAAGPSSAAVTATKAAGSPKTDATAGKMAHCPSAVSGAKTSIEDVPGGVLVTVEATGDEAIREVRARARYLVEAAKAEAPGGGRHTGTGQGGGALGRCPVVMRNTLVEASDVEGGARIVVKPKEAAEVDWLRRTARERAADMAGAREVGQKKMANCPSAVEGAITKVSEVEGGVEVAVTAKDEAAQREIRARAAHLVEASKADPTGVAHTGDGKGGGGLGRCPVVMKGTTVQAKDIEGGSLLAVKAVSPNDVATLRKEAAARAAVFSPEAAGAKR